MLLSPSQEQLASLLQASITDLKLPAFLQLVATDADTFFAIQLYQAVARGSGREFSVAEDF